jgi:methyl coenzyme M reductase subunit C
MPPHTLTVFCIVSPASDIVGRWSLSLRIAAKYGITHLLTRNICEMHYEFRQTRMNLEFCILNLASGILNFASGILNLES